MAKAQQLIREIETHHLVYYQSKPRMSFDIVKTDYFTSNTMISYSIYNGREKYLQL